MTVEERLTRLEGAVLAILELCELPQLAELNLYGSIWQAAVELEQFQKEVQGSKHAA